MLLSSQGLLQLLLVFLVYHCDIIKTCLRIHWRLSTILKTSIKSVWSNVFWHVKVYIFSKFVQYTIHWDKTQMLKKFPSDKIDVTKNALSFISRAPTHHRFISNSQFLCELTPKVYISETECEIFRFQFRIIFIKVYFLFHKKHGHSGLKLS